MELYDGTRLLHCVAKIFCVAPFSLARYPLGGVPFRVSRAALASHLVLAAIFFLAEAEQLSAHLDVFLEHQSVFQMIGTIQTAAMFVHFWVNIALSVFNRAKMVGLLNEMHAIRDAIRREDKRENKKLKYFVLGELLFTFGLNSGAHFLNLLKVAAYETPDKLWRTIYFHLFFPAMELSLNTVETQFINTAVGIGRLNARLRDRLAGLGSRLRAVDLADGEERSLVAELKAVSSLQTRLVEATEVANSVFGVTTLLSAGRFTVMIVFFLFVAIVNVRGEQSRNLYWDIPVSQLCIWTLSATSRIAFIAASCHVAVGQSQSLAVHTLNTKSQRIRSELRGFQLQLLSSRVTFDSLGLFTIDMTLFQSIVAAVSTYLVIVVQFHVASDRKIY